MTKMVEWLLLGVVAGAAGSARAAWAEGLAGLDAKLRDTGRIATLTPPSTAPIQAAAPDGGATDRARDPRRALVRIEADDTAAESARTPAAPSAADEQDLRRTEGAVADCRVEVARRRRVRPSKVAAGSVRLRFTIETSGRVREAEALSTVDTDLEVAACAKRVLSDWRFPRHAGDVEVVVERTYSFSRG
jgi:hypothetical protein